MSKHRFPFKTVFCSWILLIQVTVNAFDKAWPDFDQRYATANQQFPDSDRQAAVEQMKQRIPGLKVDFDPLLGTPRYVRSTVGFLTGAEEDPDKLPPPPSGYSPPPKPDKTDPNRALKQFLNENADLFGHDSGVLASARTTREYVTQHNQLRTVYWQQELDGIPIFDAILVAHFARGERLVSLSSCLLPQPGQASRANAITISAADTLMRNRLILSLQMVNGSA